MTSELSTIERALAVGDLSKMSPDQRATYYVRVCESLGVNPLTRPFEYITLNGKLTLYARRDAADQLRRIHGISLEITSRERIDDLYVVTARATDPEGRRDESTGVVSLSGLRGEALANALMKAETKAKRRVTLSLVGLGWLDETEVETIPGAQVVDAPSSLPEPTEPKRRWVEDDAVVQRFWSWCEDLSLSEAEVLGALGVVALSAYTGTAVDAKAAIDEYIQMMAGGSGDAADEDAPPEELM